MKHFRAAATGRGRTVVLFYCSNVYVLLQQPRTHRRRAAVVLLLLLKHGPKLSSRLNVMLFLDTPSTRFLVW